MDTGLQQQVGTVLDVLSRAQQVFGGDRVPADPPAFIAPRDLEDDIGRGCF